MTAECFAKCGSDLIIEGDKANIIRKVKGAWSYANVAYGKNWIDSTKFDTVKWTIKVIKAGGYEQGTIIGVVSNETDMNEGVHNSKKACPSALAHKVEIFLALFWLPR